MMIAEIVYGVPAVVILNSCVRAITAWDLITSMIKAWVFGAIISIVRSVLMDSLIDPLACPDSSLHIRATSALLGNRRSEVSQAHFCTVML